MTILVSIASFILIYILISWRLLLYDNPKLFTRSIRKYARQDEQSFPGPGKIICTGSSVMKYWKTIEKDLFPFPVLNRAIAGTKINEIVYWADDLVSKYNPSAVLLYAGSNDIQGFRPRTPEQVQSAFINLSQKLLAKNDSLKIFYVSIIPSPSRIRWKHWDRIKEANRMIFEYCKSENNLHYVEITKDFLNEEGYPIKSYFRADNIHLNALGYEIWKAKILPVMTKELTEGL